MPGLLCRNVGAVTTTKTTNRFLYLAAATALGLTLASCSGDGGGEETGGAEGGGDATTEQTDDATTEGDDATEDGGGAAAAGPECLVGTWEMTSEAMEEQALAQTGGEGEVSVEGTSTMTFDGTTVTTDQDSTSSFSFEVEGTTTEGSTTTDATIVMNYTADDATLTYANVVSADGSIIITAADTTQEQDAAEVAELQAGQTLNYTCTDAELTLSSEMADIEISMTFTRA